MLIVGSGNVVHNLAESTGPRPSGRFDWAQRFDDAAREHDDDRAPADAARACRRTPTSDLAVPTPDHFIPLLYLAGLAAGRGHDRHTCSSTATRSARCR